MHRRTDTKVRASKMASALGRSLLRAFSGLALLSAGLAAAPAPASALDCGQNLVVRGDNAFRVRAVCGEPSSIATRTETRVLPGLPVPSAITPTFVVQTILVEVWIYDFGPGRFVEELTFENGVLVALRPIGPSRRRGSASAARAR